MTTLSSRWTTALVTLAACGVLGCDTRLRSSARALTACAHDGGYGPCPDPGGDDVGDDDGGPDAGDDADAGTPDAAQDAQDAPDVPACEHATTTLPDLTAGLTELGCDTSVELLQQILDELARLRLLLDCDGADGLPLCPEDVAAIEAALAALQDLPQAFDCPPEVQALIDDITFATAGLLACADDDDDDDCLDDDENGVCDCVDSDNDGICDDDDDDDDTGACGETEWYRLGPPPAVGGNCTLVAATGPGWWNAGDVMFGYFLASVPGASPEPFSSWERPYDDDFAPLWPASDLLDNFGLSPSQISFLHASATTYQLHSLLDLRPLQPALVAADHIVIMYGRNNATSVYVDEATDADRFDKYYWLDYEYTPHRDSIRILDCDADELIGARSLSFGTRVAVDPPWTPYLGEQPGTWAVVLACQPDLTPPTHF